MRQQKHEKLNTGYRIGYRHLENEIMHSQKTEAQKEAWKTFEDIRDVLYRAYVTAVRDNARLSNSDFESALREVTCKESNASRDDDVGQWWSVIERYCADSKQDQLKNELLNILNPKQ